MHHALLTGARRWAAPLLLATFLVPPDAAAQDTIPPARRDSLEEALARELERLMADSARIPLPDAPRQAPQARGQGLNPDISAIGEALFDLSPDEPRFTESGERAELSEVEVGIQAVVDPYFRADFFIGIHAEVVEIEEAFLTALALPGGFQAKLGRFLLPLGKANLMHVPELHSVRHAAPVRELLGPEGLKGNGIQLSRIFAPFGFYQELQVAAFHSLEPDAHGHAHGEEEEPAGEGELPEPERGLEDQVAGLAHLKSYWDLSDAANIEVGLSGAIGTMEVERETVVDGAPAHVLERDARALWGADLTFRWRPPARAIYRSFYWTTEVLADRRSEETAWGGFSLAQWQVGRRWYVGGRVDAVQAFEEEEEHEGEEVPGEEELHDLPWRWSGSGYLTFFPSEFSRFKLALERSWGDGALDGGQWRSVLQTTFALGPHRPHAF